MERSDLTLAGDLVRTLTKAQTQMSKVFKLGHGDRWERYASLA